MFLFIKTFHVALFFCKQDTLHAAFYIRKVKENSEGTTKLCKPSKLPWGKFWVILSPLYETVLKLHKSFL